MVLKDQTAGITNQIKAEQCWRMDDENPDARRNRRYVEAIQK